MQMMNARAQGSCELANVSAMDLIEAFANDTELTISVGKRMLTHGTLEKPAPICADLGRAQVERIQLLSSLAVT